MKRLDALTLPLSGTRLIEASAGTGKTWTIATLYLRLILGHRGETDDEGRGSGFDTLAPPNILVMTFTKAATRELSERIRDRLLHAMRCFRGHVEVDGDDRVLAALLASYPAGRSRDEAAWRLATAAEGMDDAAVFTIDAWVQRMLREHAFDSGSLFDEDVDPDEDAMLAEAARDYWRQEVYPLRGEVLEGVLGVWTDPVELAGDVRRLKRYVGIDPSDHRSLGEVWSRETSNREAALAGIKAGWVQRAAQMRAWIEARFASTPAPFIGARMQRGRVSGWMDTLDRWAATPDALDLGLTDTALRRLSPVGLGESLHPGITLDIPPWFAALSDAARALRAIGTPVPAIRRHAGTHVATRLRALKQRAGAYGFDDMLERLEAALSGPSGDRLRARIVAQYPAALIDEFQDTSPVQYRIFDRLYRTSDNDPATALLLIGDPKQAIYSFRGADIQSYLKARASTGDRHYLLTTNHRSTAPLVGVINHLFESAETRAEGAFRFGPRDASGGDRPLAFVPVEARGRRDVLRTASGPVPALTLCHDAELAGKRSAQRRFAENCAEHIASSLDDPQAGFLDPSLGFTRLAPADITVLVRDRFEGAAIRRALQRRRIASVYLSDQDSVFHGAEATDLRHWLQAVADPTDGRLARIAYATAMVGLPLPRLALPIDDDPVFEARLDDLKRLNDEWHRLGILAMLRRTLHLLDLPARWLREPDGERRLTNVLHLTELLQEASAALDGEQAVIRWLTERIDEAPSQSEEQIVRLESDADLVKVVTIHKAKGLEYPVVYLPLVCSYRTKKWDAGEVVALPNAQGERTLTFDPSDDERRAHEHETQQEDVRLLYVALTRARHALWLGVAPLRAGQSRKCGFSRSAFGYLLSGDETLSEDRIAGRLEATFGALPSVRIVAVEPEPARTVPKPARAAPLVDAPDYTGRFERDWSIGSFSAFVHDLARVPLGAVMVEPAVEDELLSDRFDDAGEGDEVVPSSSNEARHRFPRGAVAGNFLHDQLEWLAARRFALVGDKSLSDQLARRCDRQGWGMRAADVVTWMSEVVDTPLAPIGVPLNGLPSILPEMEFWFPSEGMDARRVDALCRAHLLEGRERPPLPDRRLRGMLKGFTDLVFEHDGRYWVLDYKSNVLGADDAAYTRDALAASMAAHRYDVQAAIYLLALHRLLRHRLGPRYDPQRQLGGALYLFIRGMAGPAGGCHVVEPDLEWLDAFDRIVDGT